jgi:hypothetical protein
MTIYRDSDADHKLKWSDPDAPIGRLAVGVQVEWRGPAQRIHRWGNLNDFVGYLRTGHPGVITHLNNGKHILVSWYWLEAEDVSEAVGFGLDLEQYVIEPPEYHRRCARINAEGLARPGTDLALPQ